jgi:hypothetical protein
VYSPDGSHILFDSTRAGETALYVMDADGSNAVRATFLHDDWGGTWSPDGTKIAFNANPAGGPYDIYVAPFPISPAVVRLNDDSVPDCCPTWSPDGTRVAFQRESDGHTNIWSMAADGSDLRKLTNEKGGGAGFTSGGGEWGPDGRIIYTRTQDGPASSSGLVREDLAIMGMLFGGLILSILVIALVRIGAPFGTVAVIIGMTTAFAALGSGEWRFLPAAIIGGLLVDLLIRLSPSSKKAAVAGAGSAAAWVLGAGVTVIATTGMYWSPSLLLGVTLIAAGLGWAASGLIARPAFESVAVE